MSRRSLRSPSTSRKRKKSSDDAKEERAELHNEVKEQMQDAGKMSDIMSIEPGNQSTSIAKEKDTMESQVNVPGEETEVKRKDEEDVQREPLKQHAWVTQRRAIAARRRLDSFVMHRRQSLGLRIYMTQIQDDLERISSQLRSCQRSNSRLEKEFKELTTHLGVKRKTKQAVGKRAQKKRASLTKPAKSPRSHTVIVTLPNNPDDKQNNKELLILDQKTESVNQKPVLEHENENENENVNESTDEGRHAHNTDCMFTFLTLNSEEDFPDGSWLGDEDNSQMRVRCPIPPSDMLHIMRMYNTADKVALKLLDLMFDKETQAMSNISGTGKHNKKKLDPLLIFGLHCHLVKHFGITREEWHRIKQNIDSKCRTAFRRKMKGLELYPKQVRKTKRSHIDISSHFSQQCQNLQQVVNQLQTMPAQSLTGITIIQEQPDGTAQAIDPSSPALVEHTILHQPTNLHPDQLKVISETSNANEIHLSNGQTLAISQTGELEIREVNVVQAKQEH